MSEHTLESTQIPVDGIPINIAIFRYVEGTFVFVDFNDMAQKTDGVRREDLIGRPILEIFPGVEEFGLTDVMQRVYDSGEAEEIELTFYEDERISGWRNISVNRMENGNILIFFKDMSEDQEKEEQLKSLGYIVDNSMNEVFIFDAETLLFNYVNKEAQKNIGYTLDEITNLTPVDIKQDFDKESFLDLIEPILNGSKESLVFDTVHKRKDGSLYDVEIRLQFMDFGGKKNFVVIAYDITDQKRKEDELKSLGNIVDNNMNEIYIFDAESLNFTYVNKEAQSKIGYTLKEMKDMTPFDIKPDYDEQSFRDLLKPLLNGLKESLVFETMHRPKDREDYHVEIRLQLMYFNGRKQFVVTAHDISKRIKMEEMLHKLATVDSLTGIYNRHHINEELDIELERANRYNGMFALIMFDLDHFKQINDTYGHDVGDKVLKKFSRLVLNEIRESDRFGRWGGEEFILILPELNKEQALQVAEKLRKDISIHKFEGVPQVTVSIGVSTYHPESTKKSLLKRVDDAMYQAKKAGRNTVQYN